MDPLDKLADALHGALGANAIGLSQPLARYTTLRVGGRADLVVVAKSVDALHKAVLGAWESGVQCRVLGAGSNVLVGDAGIGGLVVLNRTRAITFCNSAVRAESGVILSTLARQCVARGLAGLEWAVGIPGTVGGAVIGNAGAWGGNIALRLMRASILESDGTVHWWPVDRLQYGYRTSILKRQQATPVLPALEVSRARESELSKKRPAVLEAEFSLLRGERKALEARVAELTARRRASQPPGASCGSVFKNPPSDYAGRLIEAAGLKGQRHGGAQISTVHSNFIITDGTATAADVKALIDLAAQTVQAQFGTKLELEIELIGDW
jgi:UDP-N-acetylmuramate dehydrogenase